jgi:hypothetical protein
MAEELLYRLGHAYPAGWDENGNALHSLNHVEWLDAKERETFLSHVCEHRIPRMTAYWGYILQPLINDHTTDAGVLRYRQIEHYRIPVMGFLTVDNPNELRRSKNSMSTTRPACGDSNAAFVQALKVFYALRTATGFTRSLSNQTCAACFNSVHSI